MILVKKKCKVTINILNLEILFLSMINMNMFFEFMSIILKNHMFKINLIRYFQNASGVRFILLVFQILEKKKISR